MLRVEVARRLYKAHHAESHSAWRLGGEGGGRAPGADIYVSEDGARASGQGRKQKNPRTTEKNRGEGKGRALGPDF